MMHLASPLLSAEPPADAQHLHWKCRSRTVTVFTDLVSLLTGRLGFDELLVLRG